MSDVDLLEPVSVMPAPRQTFTRLSRVHRLRGEVREALEAARRAIAGTSGR